MVLTLNEGLAAAGWRTADKGLGHDGAGSKATGKIAADETAAYAFRYARGKGSCPSSGAPGCVREACVNTWRQYRWRMRIRGKK